VSLVDDFLKIAGIVGIDVGIRPFGYLTSMVATIALWLTLAPAIGAIARTGKGGKRADAFRAPAPVYPGPLCPARPRAGRHQGPTYNAGTSKIACGD
jgi:hypothetical protein